ncbi:DUF433 domain-containing protein, partial [bacterium]|nr:DUF433 domain-containing protein [candidate division CSSED10-310 bacterium]
IVSVASDDLDGRAGPCWMGGAAAGGRMPGLIMGSLEPFPPRLKSARGCYSICTNHVPLNTRGSVMKVNWIKKLNRLGRIDDDNPVEVIRGAGITIATYRRLRAQGASDEDLLARYPQLSPMQLQYLATHLDSHD